ncbi:translational activator of GCN4 [Dipsacomyces acuminosporus]|nr:translational activator of GCN4 [Dipsacomyces acuminosporus]
MSEAEAAGAGSDFSWPSFTEELVDRLTTSRVNERRALLENELLPYIATYPVEDKELVGLVCTLTLTIDRYIDRESRALVLKVLKSLSAKKANVFVKVIAGVLDPVVESAQPKSIGHPDSIATAVASRLVLLSWIDLALCTPVAQLGATPESLAGDAAWKKLVSMAARLLWGIVPAHAKTADSKLRSVSNSAHREVWRTLRAYPSIIGPMLSVLTSPACGSEAAVLIGNVTSTAIILSKTKGESGDGGQSLEEVVKAKDAIVSFIDRALISSKVPLPYSSIADLSIFLREFVGSEFESLFKPSISKMLLRSPEAVLPTCLWLLQALGNDRVDLTAIYLDVFADTLASNLLKSSNASVRAAACDLFAFLSNVPRTEEAATKAAEITTKPLVLGRFSQAEHRADFYRLLGDVHAGVGNGWPSSVVIMPALLKMTAKETVEASVSALFSAIGKHFSVLINHLMLASSVSDAGYSKCEETIKLFSEAALKGLALPDRSALVRQSWAADAIGKPLWDTIAQLSPDAHPWAAAHIYPLLQSLAATAEKATANPLSAGSGTLDAHVGLALALRCGAPIANVDAKKLVSLVTDTEKSLLLWDKVYHKCTTPRDCEWALRSVEMLFSKGSDDPRQASLLIWALCRFPEPTLQVIRGALEVIRTMSLLDASRLWSMLEQKLFAEMTASLAADQNRFKWTSILSALTVGVEAADVPVATKMDLLVAMALAAHHPAVIREAGRESLWIALIQRALVDPGELCHAKLSSLKQIIKDAMVSASSSSSDAFAAATGLIKDLVFIGSDGVALRLLEFARNDINPAELTGISREDIQVWRTPADQLYNDPIVVKEQSQALRGGSKKKNDDWEAQLREEIARKSNKARKLTKDEQELVDKQWAKENAIRERVANAHDGLHRGLAVVQAVVEGSVNVASACMLELVRIVVERAIIGGSKTSEELAGAAVLDTVMSMSKAADGLEETLRSPITMGLLRARGFENVVPGGWKQESMEDLATRLYFRLRVSCESSPLPSAGFNFLFPFMQATADHAGWGRRIKKGIEEHDEYAQMDHAAEQLTMVVDILSFHAHFGNVAEMPRKEMIELMVFLMSSQPTLLRACRDSLVKMAEEMEGTDTPLERDALLDGLLRSDSVVRGACLAALDFVDLTELDYSEKLWINTGGSGSENVALEENAELARTLWAENGMEVLPGLIMDIIPYLNNAAPEIRACAARSIGFAIQERLDLASDAEETDVSLADVQAEIDAVLGALQDAYRKWYISLDPEYDEFGIVVPGTQHRVDIAESRVATADALLNLAPLLTSPSQVQSLIRFLVRDRALGERSEDVRAHMLSAGAQAVATHGAKWSSELLPILEEFLSEPDEGTESYDNIREGVVVLLGRLAQHLPTGEEERVADAVDQLIATLSTPSESVQSAVSECLPPLAKRIAEDKFAQVIASIMDAVLNGERYPQRRGAAYGLSGLVKGRGLAVLKKYQVIDQLREACANSKAFQQRQGALFAFETLSGMLGRLFEPYIIQFVPTLLLRFGDSNIDVREAAMDAARVIMANISGHAVKLILPSALAGLDDDQWRTKKGSVEILGSMAYCAPKQLSVSLPTIVPHIINVLTDTHGQVSAAARQALLRFGEVIHNPEIQELVPTLLGALDDPAKNTDSALRTLLHTAFIHYIDAPSLALIIPILQRGMRARTASTKRNAAQIMGSMATLTDPKDLGPYLESLVPLLRDVLVDPVPETRATAAKALGSLVQKLGEEKFPSLVADLVKVLKSDASGVDRAGAAQGLSEVLSGIGMERLEGLVPEILANCNSTRVPVREGFMMLLIYLPVTFGEEFQRFLPQVIPPVLSGLADENEQVRDASMRAGRILVVSYSKTAVDQLLPELLSGLQHESWRIRHSSVDLLGELLYRVAGISGKQAEKEREEARAQFFAVQSTGEGEEDDENAEEGEEGEAEEDIADEAAISSNLRAVLNEQIGTGRCNSVLSALYVARSDVSAMVRQAAFSVWKSIINNTPRTVRECLPQIMDIVLTGLASQEYDRRTTAARTLGDLVRKLGEAVMSQIVPILESALDDEPAGSESGGARHGVFIGLTEILQSASKAYVDVYADAMVPLVRRGLCDEDAMVREAAATAFDGLQQAVGPSIIDLVVPPLLNALTDTSDATRTSEGLAGINAEHALEALRELMAVRANVVFPVLIPTLTQLPVSAFHARALSSLIQVSGSSLSKRLSQILLALFESLPVHHASGDQEAESALRDTVRVVVTAASQDEDTLESLMMQFHESVKVNESTDLSKSPADVSRVAETCFAMEAMCKAFGPNSASRGRTLLGSHIVDWLRIFIDLLAAEAELVVKASWSALDAMCKTIPKEDYDGYVGPVSRAVQRVTEALPNGQDTLPGFNLPKGIGPILPIYSQGLLTGSPDTKERAVRGMARLVRFTDPAALRPFATGITGPLIRIVGDKHPANVKAAILNTLGLLLKQIPALMRPFLPQLQRTFVRGLTEQDDLVRQRAAAALAALIPLQPRLDPLVSELTTGIKQAEALGMKLAMMKAIRAVIRAPNAKSLSPNVVQSIEAVVVGRAEGVENSESASDFRWRSLKSEAFGSLCGIIPEEAAIKLVNQHAAVDARDSADAQANKLHALAAVLSQSPALFSDSEELQAVISSSIDVSLAPSSSAQQPLAALQAVRVAKNALLQGGVAKPGSAIVAPLVSALVRAVDPETMSAFDSDTQQAAMAALKTLAKRRYADIIEPVRDAVVAAAMSHVRDRNITVKLAAERCVLYALRLARVPTEGFDGDDDGLKSYVENMGGATSDKGKQVLDYQRRVLNKLADSTRELDYASDDDDISGSKADTDEVDEDSDNE